MNPSIKVLIVCFCCLIFIPFQLSAQDSTKFQAERPTIGLVLSGGGAKGFAHVGVIKVLEEAGIKPDFIGGTSMGSIIGGLYAIGYSPEFMENMIRTQDWEMLLQDRTPRDLLSYEEKNSERFLATFPLSLQGVKLRRGIYSGQNIETLLTGVTSPVYGMHDFSNFPIPFLCIGTDLVTGEEVILDKGSLHRAMRASMAIPSFFTPYSYQGHLLVDGGVINNYPVNRVKERGADIIIGVDVQDSAKTEEQLNSLVSVLDQITGFYRLRANEQGRSKTDYYIRPDITSFSLLDFEKFDSIIYQGEVAARAMLPQLKKLADSLNTYFPQEKKKVQLNPLDSVYIADIRVLGRKKIKSNMVLGKLNLLKGEYHQLSAIQRGVQRVYGTRFFEKVSYEFIPSQNGYILLIDVEELSDGQLGAGINVNSDYNVALMLNATFRNIGIGGSKLFVDLIIGEMPRFNVLYLYDLGNKPGFGINLDGHSFRFHDYNSDGDRENRFDVTNYTVDVFTQMTFQNSFVFGLGGQFKYARIENEFPLDDELFYVFGGGDFHPFISAYIFTKMDTYDKIAFSTRGFHFDGELRRLSNIDRDDLQNQFSLGTATTYYADYRHNIPVSRKITLKPGFTFAGIIDDDLPLITDWYLLGGQVERHYSKNFIPFTGLNLIERLGLYTAVARMDIQYNIARKQYLTVNFDTGNTSLTFEELSNFKNVIAGYGLTYGYESFIGPIELSFMGSNTSPKLKFFVNIGFSF